MQPPQGGFGYQHSPQQQPQQPAQPVQPVQHYQQPVQQYQQPVQQFQQPNPNPFQLVNVSGIPSKKTFFAASISVFIILLGMLAPFVEFDHEETNSREEREFCEAFLAGMKAGVSDTIENFDPDEQDCPMNGFETMGYAIDLMDSSEGGDDDDDESSSDFETEETFFAIALIMLFAAPFVFLFSVIAGGISLSMKKHPIVIGVIHILFFVAFWFCTLMGSIDVGEELTVHSNFTGFGMFICGFAGIGLLIRH